MNGILLGVLLTVIFLTGWLTSAAAGRDARNPEQGVSQTYTVQTGTQEWDG